MSRHHAVTLAQPLDAVAAISASTALRSFALRFGWSFLSLLLLGLYLILRSSGAVVT
ncbi:MAG: hypothetical protein ABI609_18040 [Acidobacteriota bacterium]